MNEPAEPKEGGTYDPKLCGVKGCQSLATKSPVLKLRAYKGATPGEMVVDLGLCDLHAASRTVDSIMSDEMFASFEHVCRAGRKMLPKRELTTLYLISRDEAIRWFEKARAEQKRSRS